MSKHSWTAILLLSALAPLSHIAMAQVDPALEGIQRKAAKGNPEAQHILGDRYMVGRGVAQDYAEAVKWYRKAAEQGWIKSQLALALSLQIGMGVPTDPAESAKWYRRTAEIGDGNGQHALSMMYEAGSGVPKDLIEAYRWRLLSYISKCDEFAEKMTPAQLAEAEQLARDWKPQSETEGNQAKPHQWDGSETIAELIDKAQHGDTGAQYSLSFRYEDGEGVLQSYVEAYKWYILAERSQGTARIAKQMTPAELETAEGLARDWRPGSKKQAALRTATAPLEANDWKILACTIEKSPVDQREGNTFTVRFKERGQVFAFQEEIAASVNTAEISFTTTKKIHLTVSRINGRFVRLFEGRLMENGSCILATKPKF